MEQFTHEILPHICSSMKTPEVMKILAERYSAPSHAFIEEFRGGTGYKVEQRCDALAMDLWPSSKMGLKLMKTAAAQPVARKSN